MSETKDEKDSTKKPEKVKDELADLMEKQRESMMNLVEQNPEFSYEHPELGQVHQKRRTLLGVQNDDHDDVLDPFAEEEEYYRMKPEDIKKLSSMGNLSFEAIKLMTDKKLERFTSKTRDWLPPGACMDDVDNTSREDF